MSQFQVVLRRSQECPDGNAPEKSLHRLGSRLGLSVQKGTSRVLRRLRGVFSTLSPAEAPSWEGLQSDLRFEGGRWVGSSSHTEVEEVRLEV